LQPSFFSYKSAQIIIYGLIDFKQIEKVFLILVYFQNIIKGKKGLVNMGLFGKEKITLLLEKYDYKPGEKIKGKIKLNLKKPILARKLEVKFIGRRVDKKSSTSIAGLASGSKGHHSTTSYTNIFDFSMPIDEEKEYQNQEYPFEIKIPEDILQNNPTLEGKLGQVSTAFRMIAGVSTRIDWIVHAQLDIPKKFDVKISQKIILSEN
jgi:hypothetical protein